MREYVKAKIDDGLPFTDPSFMPVRSSIYDDDEEITAPYMDLDWKRLSDIYPNQTLFGDNIQLSTVIQGKLGDCYFLTALEHLTNQPS